MTIRRIELGATDESESYFVALDGVDFELRLKWQDRIKRWALDVLRDGDPVLCGCRLAVGSIIGAGVVSDSLWTGALVCVDLDGDGEPFQADISDPARVVLEYEDAAAWSARLAEPDIVTVTATLI